ncbi:MAG: DUF1524 domain-containing protein, partial [Phycisphaerae bacterium]|nr:DUF1524 domain-containing protein [Phycisphaerae bacterium]
EFISCLKLVEGYVFRRSVCGIPTNSLNKTFAQLSRELDKDRYLESLNAAFVLKDSYRRFPTDREFKQEITNKDMYHIKNRNYWLRKLENHDRTKETVEIEEYTIEHIMPQNENLSPAWKQALGENWQEVQGKYLHTIGNLTLTGYNPEMSDRPFKEKRDMENGFRDSPIRLNKSLASLEKWDEEEILKRAETLGGLAERVWSFPKVSQELLAEIKEKQIPAKTEIYTLEDHPHLKGKMLELFEQFRRRVLNLDDTVREEVLKSYIAYKLDTNFIDVVPQASRLRISINMKFDQIHDPKSLCKDVSQIGRLGNGDIEVGLSSIDQLDDMMYFVRQSFELHSET